jgi:hypothetical protein
MQSRKVSFKITVLIAVLLLAVVLVGGWVYRASIRESVVSFIEKESLPTPVEYEEIKKTQAVQEAVGLETEETSVVVKRREKDQEVTKVNLAVPFSPQAPHANWDQPYQDACEEAAVIMVAHYLEGKSLNADKMNSEILRMVAWEEDFLGFYKDTNIAETTRLVNNYYPALQAKAVYDVTAQDIKKELQVGRAVVVLANGQRLANPYYTQPGPEKHALVIKGFTDGKFITNDPGTKRGADYVYTTEKVYGSIVDYDGGAVGTGKKAMIIITTRTGD